MPPRRRQDAARTAEAYNYASAEKLNNPTGETALGMEPHDLADQPIPEMEEEERVRHPRLQWNRGKQTDHSRTFGPLYIHDKVSPEQFLKTLTKTNPQRDMWALLNGLPEDAAAKPYEYSGHWTNRLIRATAQRAMASLLYKDGMRGRVNLIYMDPPYNKSFRSNFQASADTPETEEDWDHLPNDPVAIKAFRDTYRDGVHSYLDGLYEQLTLGRELLAEDGSFFVQIGADNVHEVVMLMAEVFGRENHVATIPYRTTTNPSTNMIPEIGNWIVWYAKDKNIARRKYRQMYEPTSNRAAILDYWEHRARFEEENGEIRSLTRAERNDPTIIPNDGKIFMTFPCHSEHTSYSGRSDNFYYHGNGEPCPESGWSRSERQEAEAKPHHDHVCRSSDCYQAIPDEWQTHKCTKECDAAKGTRKCPKGRKCGPQCGAILYPCPPGCQWRVSLRGLQVIGQKGRLTLGKNIQWKFYEDEIPGTAVNAIWENSGRVTERQYVVETPPKVLERCLLMTTDPGDLVLDLTCGSGAMPFQAETWGRRWIAIDVAQVSIAIARERLITNTYPYHMLKDSPEGAKLDHEAEQALLPPEERTPFAERPADTYKHDPQGGFVVERQLRVSAGTLAYGQGDEDPIKHPDRTVKVNSRVRVASPFTVESDSPYRSITPGEENGQQQDTDVETILQTTGFTVPEPEGKPLVIKRITDSLESSGIGQPGKGRYKVENLAPSDVMDVTHSGTLLAPDGDRHSAYFYIGREDEVISAVQTRNAATAIANVDPACRHLVMVGFGRDGNAHSVGRYRPGMTILQVQTNRDLQLPWLKEDKTDSAFTIISEPEIRLYRLDDERVQLEVVGLNCFNPKLGVVEVGDARQIMGIMVDTEYDTESFRARLINVRQVGRNQRTLRNLRAAFHREVDQEKWEQMLTTKTIPFELPERGVKIAVKVIDQTGMEHMTVIDDPRGFLPEGNG